MPYGQVVLGPPGSGKSTYCAAASAFLNHAGRKTAIVNLDPANDASGYTPLVDVRDLVSLERVMDEFELGPNGGLIYCMEFLERNLDWLVERLAPHSTTYLLFDLPGQVELSTHHSCLKNLVQQLEKLQYRLAAVHLVDSHSCADPSKFMSVLLLSLSAMLHLELPHINVLSKIDILERYGKLPFGLDFFTEVQDLDYLVDHLKDQLADDPISQRYGELTERLCEVASDFRLVSFALLSVKDSATLLKVLRAVDRSNGYSFGTLELADASLLDVIARQEERVATVDLEERYAPRD